MIPMKIICVHASERDGVEYRKAKVWEIMIGMAKNGATVCFYLVIMYASMVATPGYGIAAGTVGIVITNDPTQHPMTGVVGTIYSYFVPMIVMNIVTFVILACIGLRKMDVKETFEGIDLESGEEKESKLSLREMWSVVSNLVAGVLIGSYAATQMVGNFTQIVGIFFAFGSGIFIAKWGAKKATTVWSWISIALSAATVLLCLGLGGPNGMDALGVMGVPIIIYALLTLGRTGANMALTTAGSAMRADIVDYEYERSGNYMPAVVSAIYNLTDLLDGNVFDVWYADAGMDLQHHRHEILQTGPRAYDRSTKDHQREKESCRESCGRIKESYIFLLAIRKDASFARGIFLLTE